ncbi:PilW family protein [Colwellia sp. 6_MG-2023]|uniref:PilW family protein n=1 Tax=Colwellia sp. 6_MG-2023 TaxID=3062676 RepID=UPI0026E4038C|nr:PilW family protein [Colwellia sp. 6_MG-2023]MDO6487946.1 PilW family protein [Colwellia sp. 6_MG-2023]
MKIKKNKQGLSVNQMAKLGRKYQSGFSLVEVFVALIIGLVIFAGVLSVFVGMRTTTSETSSYGELQENGRFAISVLTDDLLRQDFWGDYIGFVDLSRISSTLAAPVGECVGGGINNGTFPLAVGHFRTLWGETATSAKILSGCREDAKIGSDILQLKRVVSTPLALTAGDVAPAGNYYFVSNMNTGVIFSAGIVPNIEGSQVWEYQHHIYYVREETHGSNTVPVLMQGRLANTLSFAPIIDGIELVRFEYGVDMETDPTDPGYGIVNAYIPATSMTDELWNNAASRIISVKVYVLARSILEDKKYTNTNTYKLGNLTYTVNDNYRRLLFSSTVTLYNAGMDIW